jgi:hypothetical protein
MVNFGMHFLKAKVPGLGYSVLGCHEIDYQRDFWPCHSEVADALIPCLRPLGAAPEQLRKFG